jgi:hypothetical protein
VYLFEKRAKVKIPRANIKNKAKVKKRNYSYKKELKLEKRPATGVHHTQPRLKLKKKPIKIHTVPHTPYSPAVSFDLNST